MTVSTICFALIATCFTNLLFTGCDNKSDSKIQPQSQNVSAETTKKNEEDKIKAAIRSDYSGIKTRHIEFNDISFQLGQTKLTGNDKVEFYADGDGIVKFTVYFEPGEAFKEGQFVYKVANAMAHGRHTQIYN